MQLNTKTFLLKYVNFMQENCCAVKNKMKNFLIEIILTLSATIGQHHLPRVLGDDHVGCVQQTGLH